MSWLWQPLLPAAAQIQSAVAPVTAKPRATMQHLEYGFITARNSCFQPSEDGAIS